jgi:SAM-dependent methyltransferase
MKNFDHYASYYDLLNRDKNYAYEAKYVFDLLTEYRPNCHDVLEFGSGTGAHADYLTKYGYKIDGIEISETMHEIACKKDTLVSHLGDITKYSTGKTYDAVVSLFHVMNYQTSDNQIQSVFSNASKHLNPGGIFLFDFWFTPAVYSISPSCRVKKMSNKDIHVTRIAEPQIDACNNIVEVKYDIFVENKKNKDIAFIEEVHQMRPFGINELKAFAENNGFSLSLVQEFGTGDPLTTKTWGGAILFKKVTNE